MAVAVVFEVVFDVSEENVADAMSVGIIGREAELGIVTRFLDSLSTGPAGLVLQGEPGIGKTTLWVGAVGQARRRGFRILACRPAAVETQLSYASLADLLGDLPAAVLGSLPDPQRRAIDVVLLRSDPEAASPDRRATGAALLSIVERLADDGPVLLAIDDLQWMDTSSVQAIGFAVRRLRSPVGVLAALRIGEHDDPGPLVRLPDPDRMRHLRVGPLSLGALHGVIRARLGQSLPRPAMVRVQQVSGGNPFYALELARTVGDGRASGPVWPLSTDLAHLVRDRVGRIPAGVQQALLAVAALADPTVEAVQLAVRIDSGEVDRLLENAERAGLIRLDGHRVQFTHALLAAGVYAAASPGDRRAMHRRLAAGPVDLEERARHLALGAVRADQETAAALDEAADRARRRGAPAAAAELLDLAVELGADAPERRIRSAQHHFDAGDPVRARTMLEEVVAALAPGRLRAEALRLLATLRLHDDDYREAASYLQRALDETGTDRWLRVRILIELLYVLVNLGRIPDANQLTGSTVADAEGLGDPGLLANALAGAVMIRFLSGGGLDEPTLRRALELENRDVPAPIMLRPSLISSLLLGWTGRLDQARDQLVALRRSCLDRGEESDLMFGAFHHVIVECWRGNLAEAHLIAEDTLERAWQLGTGLPFAVALSTHATVAAYAGRTDEARRAAREALVIFERGSCLAVTVWPTITLGFLEVSLGNYEAAAATLGPLVGAATAMGYGEPTAAPFAPDAAEALIAVGRLDEAAALVEQLERNGRRLDRAWALALGARCRSLLLAARGDLDAASDAAERSLAEHERLPMPFERARTQLVLGRIQRRRRLKRAAATALQDAVRVFDELGTPLWAARARADLERVGAGHSGGTELTPSERRVAELAATGMTNRDVAAALFISAKTVEANLARVYRKLSIRSRAELGHRMAAAPHRETPDSSR
ncbi:AAA family ATPase [Sphaerisporangium sp. NPDC088356]|uniref:helix-turn-helix transcriptional regulator n=1 Tax=Sphaerisporangium sp. NPDC088356 TaxID=3154871 RepID=UPI003442BC4F